MNCLTVLLGAQASPPAIKWIITITSGQGCPRSQNKKKSAVQTARLMEKNFMEYKKPIRSFEDSGVVDPAESYYIKRENITNRKNQDMKTMVDKGRYFSIFAPRQSGKTTFFKEFCKELEKDSTYIAIRLTFQKLSNYSSVDFYQYFQKIFYENLIERLKIIDCPQLDDVQNFLSKHEIINNLTFSYLFEDLNKLIKRKKIVLFIDEFEGIPLQELSPFLMALRDLYQDYKDKPDRALYSVGLVGVRNIAQLSVEGTSPFNIADHVEIPPFTLKNIQDLYVQYTQETNQPFTEEAVQKIFEETAGQPWLVNRIASIVTTKVKPETIDHINIDDVNKGIDLLLEENNEHFENLLKKILLYKNTFEKVLNNEVAYSPNDSSQQWLRQYGLLKNVNKKAVIANPVYLKRYADISEESPLAIPGQKKKIFISYAREDKEWIEKLAPYLISLRHKGIEFWFDKDIKPGDNWSVEIQNAIETSQVTLCLISTAFLASEFILLREIPEIQNKQKEGMIVIPILLEECLWEMSDWIKSMQMYPGNGKSLEEFNDRDQKKKFMEIVSEIGRIFDSK